MRIEIVHTRDPDEGCEHTVYIDGVEATVIEVYDVDPGAGWLRSEWDETTDTLCAHASPAAAELLRSVRDEVATGSRYIEADLHRPEETQ